MPKTKTKPGVKPTQQTDELLDQARAVCKQRKITIGERLKKTVIYAPAGTPPEELEIVRQAVRAGKLKPEAQK